MKSITITGQKRESLGKAATRDLRNAEQVPCVVYGGKDAMHFSTPERSFKNLVYTPDAHTVVIELEGEKIDAVLQDIQFHPVTDKILHVDFYQLNAKKSVIMEIPVHLNKGKSKGLMAGGTLQHNLRKLKIKSLPANLPDTIDVDLTNVEIGGKIYVESLRNDKFEILHPDNAVIAAIKMSRAAMKAAQDAAKTATTGKKK